MHALSTSAPQLGQSSSIMQNSLPVPSAPPMTAGPDDATLNYPHIWQPSEGEHDIAAYPQHASQLNSNSKRILEHV